MPRAPSTRRKKPSGTNSSTLKTSCRSAGWVIGFPGAANAFCTSRTIAIGSVIAPTQRIVSGS